MALWTVESGPDSYHDSPAGEQIEVGFVWTISRGQEQRQLRIEVAPDAVHNGILVAALLRGVLDEEQPPQRLVVLPDGQLRQD